MVRHLPKPLEQTPRTRVGRMWSMEKSNREMGFLPEAQSEEEWEKAWSEFARLARQYDWPEELVQAYLQGRVSYQERLDSIKKARQLWERGCYGEAIIENKRTQSKVPLSPVEAKELKELFRRSEDAR